MIKFAEKGLKLIMSINHFLIILIIINRFRWRHVQLIQRRLRSLLLLAHDALPVVASRINRVLLLYFDFIFIEISFVHLAADFAVVSFYSVVEGQSFIPHGQCVLVCDMAVCCCGLSEALGIHEGPGIIFHPK